MSDNLQIKLLRVLQEKEIVRLGSKKVIPVDARVITATNKDLSDLVNKGKFRDDLYYRINVFLIKLPLLKDRSDDVPVLSKYYLERFNTEFGKSVQGISAEAFELLKNHSWPGNIRELENMIKSAVVLADDLIKPEHLVNLLETNGKSSEVSREGSLKDVKKNIEKELIEKTLSECKWNKTRAAKILDVDYKTLYNKMKEYGIK